MHGSHSNILHHPQSIIKIDNDNSSISQILPFLRRPTIVSSLIPDLSYALPELLTFLLALPTPPSFFLWTAELILLKYKIDHLMLLSKVLQLTDEIVSRRTKHQEISMSLSGTHLTQVIR